MGENHAAVIQQVGQASRVRLTLIGPTHVVTPVGCFVHRAKRLGAGLTSSPAHRRRALLEAWERNPLLRAFVLDRWGSQCQVDGCTIQGEVPAHLAHSIVDVHHLTHVSSGGSDSPMNLSVLCTAPARVGTSFEVEAHRRRRSLGPDPGKRTSCSCIATFPC